MSSPIGMEVPEGGSDCAKCKYYDPDASTPHGTCGNSDFVRWHRKQGVPSPEQIPLPPTRYCCNFYDWDKPSEEGSDD